MMNPDQYPITPDQLLGTQPDILVIITDQERYPTHWPANLRDQLMPSWSNLAARGLTFNRAYCSSAQCSPSRACILTGEYSNINGVPEFPDSGMPTIASLPNIATVLSGAGYDVFWKGKWHLSHSLGFTGGPPSNENWSEADIEAMYKNYGMQEWNAPDAGNSAGAYIPSSTADKAARAADLGTAGAGIANNDGRFLEGYQPGSGQTPGFGESTLELLTRLGDSPRGQRKPFALFVSFVNPHDITFFPDGWQDAGYGQAEIENLGIKLPPVYVDSFYGKPSVQKKFKEALDKVSPFTGSNNTELNYVNFYAHMHSKVEQQIGKLLTFIDTIGLTESTVIVRTSDHGELGLSHGLREKHYTAYEEMIHVPLVISNPVLFPRPKSTEAFYSHVDLLPTLASIAQAKPVGVGKSMLPVILAPEYSVQDNVLFTFDDNFLLDPSVPNSHIRALREGDWMYAVYFGIEGIPPEYELYNLKSDPIQMNNLVNIKTPPNIGQWIAMHTRLFEKMVEAKAMPSGFNFPPTPDINSLTGILLNQGEKNTNTP